ncbi:Uma2 family endonuclease [Leptolyngbya sp. FACHB-711]|uniref:Uma2 family endonuclease n=1 Tax=unclassified Leptolyngbya TaxID=2650499 RepID=UPI0016864B4F|nr:Uma2 family endonuclease [Leptolyngbya sp. FACHB-711]MBD1848660.1 Uma2 family endonuclease [Cyanobacteria bacterium FACHB-502]MBD2024370.1 Uma2 family endonuclease [Leptolyngbya sp. FACHB-711]
MVDTPSQQKVTPPMQIPPLESGDRLTRHEFERRYEAMPHLKKAELIEGVVYVPAALRFRSHGQPHGNLMTWLGVYQAFTPKVLIGDNPTVRLDRDNEPQPDAVLLIEESAGGQARLSPDDYIEGAPELVVEVAASSASIDLGDKKRAYRRNGVQEYLVWQVFDRKIDWFQLEDDDYLSLAIDEQGIIQSSVFPGLWLATSALLNGEMQQVLAVLQQGINSEEHQQFVQQLAQAR